MKLRDFFGPGDNDLVEAVSEKDARQVEEILSRGTVDVNKADDLGMTPLAMASLRGSIQIASLLLAHPEINPNRTGPTGVSPLMLAIRENQIDIVKMLLAHPQIDVNQQSQHGASAIINAAGLGHMEIVKILLVIPGLSIAKTYTDRKYSPLDIASKNGHADVVAAIEAWSSIQNQAPAEGRANSPSETTAEIRSRRVL